MFKINELIKIAAVKLIGAVINNDISVSGISIDSRTIKPGQAFIAVKGNNFDGHDFINEAIKKGAVCVISESGFRLKDIGSMPQVARLEVKDTVRALGDIARFWRQKFDIPVIAVTGSNGKTTTKDMAAWILSKRFKVLKSIGTQNNQIGLPLTLLNLDASYDCAVLEIGTNHPGEIEYLSKICLANIGLITNIGPSHLEFLKDLKGVFDEKYALVEFLKKPRIAMLNADDDLLKKELNRAGAKRAAFGFGIKNYCDFQATDIKFSKAGIQFLARKYKFRLKALGYSNVYNALSAIAVARILGMSYKDIALRLAAFSFPQGRLNFIKLGKLRFIDDTYNSNPASLSQALDVLDKLKVKGRKIMVMGDMLELGPRGDSFHQQAGKDAARICDAFITVGMLSRISADTAREAGFDSKSIFVCETSSQARDILFRKLMLGPDDIVLVKGSRSMKMEEVLKGE